MVYFYLKPHIDGAVSFSKIKEFLKRAAKSINGTTYMVGLVQHKGFMYLTCGVEEIYLAAFQTIWRSLFDEIEFETDTVIEHFKALPDTDLAHIRLIKNQGYPLKVLDETAEETMDYLIQVFQDYSYASEFFMLGIYLKEVGTTLHEKVSKTVSGIGITSPVEKVAEQIKVKAETKQFYTNIKLMTCFTENAIEKQFYNSIKTYLAHFSLKDSNALELVETDVVPMLEAVTEQSNKLSIDEIISLWHFPKNLKTNKRLILNTGKSLQVPREVIEAASDKTATLFGIGSTEQGTHLIGIKQIDRNTHTYIIGKTGAGKTKLLELLMSSDIAKNKGVILLDPHGDTARNILHYVPKERVSDTLYIDFTDRDFVIGFNPLEISHNQSAQISIESFIEIFKKYFSVEWNPKLEFLLRQALLALHETGHSSIPELVKLLTQPVFRQEIIEKLKDETIKTFWSIEYNRFAEQYATTAVSPLTNRLSEMLLNKRVRRIISMPKSSFNLEECIQQKKIVVFNLSVGELGEFSSSFLGAMIISKILQIMLAQSNIAEEKRNEVNLYVDEFQNFSTESFIKILSEARKYKLAMTLAHQYLSQIPQTIREAILGNVGNIITFRLGQSDANILTQEFNPHLEPEDFVQLNNRSFWAKISIDGKISAPFGGRTLDLIEPDTDYSRTIEQNMHTKSYLVHEADKMIEGTISFSPKNEMNTFPTPIV